MNRFTLMDGFLNAVNSGKAFTVAAMVLNSVAFIYLCNSLIVYLQAFGWLAIAMIGQFLIGVYFILTVYISDSDLSIILSSVGMFILVNSF